MELKKYTNLDELKSMPVGSYIKFDSDFTTDLCEIHKVLTGWIYVFTDNAIFVPNVLNIEMHKTAWPLG